MKIDYIRESSWKGTFYLTRRCSQCDRKVEDDEAKFCSNCGHEFKSRPTTLDGSKVAKILEAHYKEGK